MLKAASAALMMCLAVAGCFGNSVTVEGGSGFSGTKSESVRCGVSGTLIIVVQGAGSVTVEVQDGGGETIFKDTSRRAGGEGQGTSLSGEPGRWTLSVTVNTGFAGDYEATLRC